MKMLFPAISLSAVLLLAGCSEERLDISASSKDKKTLEFFVNKVETGPIFNELIEDFEKNNPDIEIKQVIVPEGMTVLKSRIARGDTPDIFITYPIEQDYIIRAKKGYLLDLSDESFLYNIQPAIQKRYIVKGRTYGVALTQNAVGVLYNKDDFRKLNISIPTTWNEFVSALKMLDSNGKTALLMPNKEANRSSIFNLNLVANEFDNDYWGQENLSIRSDKKWEKISEKILTVLSYVKEDSFKDDYYATNRKFAHGEGSMYIMGTWALPSIEEYNPYLNYGIFPFPATNSAEENKVLGGVDIGLAISSETEYPREAKKFLAFLTEKENAGRLSAYEGSISTVNGVNNNREELQLLEQKIKYGKSVNWPNHYWAGGTASESEFRKYTLQFYADKNITTYLGNLEDMYNYYNHYKE